MGLFDIFKQIKKEFSNEVKTEDLPKDNEPVVRVNDTKIEHKEPTQKKQVVVSNDGEIPNLKDILPTLTVSKDGLYPQEILMLDYAHTYKSNGENSFQNFWKWRYYVLNPQEILDKLYQEGFIETGDLKSTLQKKTLPEIKEELSNIGQKTSGKKADLIDLLLSTGDISYLEKKFSDRLYVLTEKGKAELESKENEYITYLHQKHEYMSVYEMNYFLHNENPSHLRYRDIIWRELNKKSGEYFQAFDFGLYRNCRLSMHSFILEENKPKTALHLLCEVISYDLSGLGNGYRHSFATSKLLIEGEIERLTPYENSMVKLYPGILNFLKSIKDILDISDNEFREEIKNNLKELKTFKSIFTVDEKIEIVFAEVDGNTDKLEKIYAKAAKRMKDYVATLKD